MAVRERDRWIKIESQHLTTWTGRTHIKSLFAMFLRSERQQDWSGEQRRLQHICSVQVLLFKKEISTTKLKSCFNLGIQYMIIYNSLSTICIKKYQML